MKKRRKVSMAWFLFFGALSCLLSNQLEAMAAVLAGIMIAWWVTSRIKIKSLYILWLIFPILSLTYTCSMGDKAVEWCEGNNPSAKIDKYICQLEGISGQKVPEAVHNFLLDESPEADDGIPTLVDKVKEIVKSGF